MNVCCGFGRLQLCCETSCVCSWQIHTDTLEQQLCDNICSCVCCHGVQASLQQYAKALKDARKVCSRQQDFVQMHHSRHC
jgi:hypothetical protein